MVVHMKNRSPTSLIVLCDIAAKIGVGPETCLANTGLTFDQLQDPNSQHTTRQEVQAIENLVRSSPRTIGLGVDAGQTMHVHAFGIWGFAILTSPTLREAVEISIKYIKLSSAIADIYLRDDCDSAILGFDLNDLPPLTRRFIAERHITVALNFIKELGLEREVDTFTVISTENDAYYIEKLSNLLGIPAKAAESRNGLTFPSRLLDQPLPKSDPVSMRFCVDQCNALLADRNGPLSPWSQKVRETLVEDIATEHTIENIAKKLTVTERTLRRRLTDEGVRFRDLYADTRMAIARELLDVAGLNVETVAWRVGYAEPASFIRAFSKKFGTTPGMVRVR